MIPALIIITLWLMIGLYSLTLENVEHEDLINYPFAIFLVMIPFFPWILKCCGVVQLLSARPP